MTEEELKGGAALMLKINRHPGWGAVAAQAAECGMTPVEDGNYHLTVVFFGRDLSPERAAAAIAATGYAMRIYAGHWNWHQREEARKRGILEIQESDIEPAFIPVRFSGEIGQFQNKTATHVYAAADSSPALIRFRREVVEAYKGRIPTDAYRPHVTLASGPAGSALARAARVPSGATNAKSLVLKLGKIRETFSF